MTRTILVRTAVLVAAGILLPVSAGPPAAAESSSRTGTRVITACVSRATGQMRLIRRGHCRRGERAVRWNRPGAAGPAGPTGAIGPAGGTLVIRDATGAVVPGVLAIEPTRFLRLVDGVMIEYRFTGEVSSQRPGALTYVSADCSGPPHYPAEQWFVAGSQQRLVINDPVGTGRTSYAFGPARLVAGGTALSQWSDSGTCGTYPAYYDPTPMIELVPTGPAPAALPGPLTLSLT